MTKNEMQRILKGFVSKNRDMMKTNHAHPCCKVWEGTDGIIRRGHFGPNLGSSSGQCIDNNDTKDYTCPRGHTFKSKSPIIVAVDEDPEYNTGPICSYCYVDWFKANLNAHEVIDNL